MSIDDYLRWNSFITGTLWVDIVMLVIIAVFLVFSAFFSSIETALSTANILRIKKMAEEKRRGARKAVVMMENFNRTLTCILIGNNLVNIGASTVSAFIFTSLLNDQTVASLASTFVMTMLVITFGEILPKTYAKTYSTTLAVKLAPIMWIFYKLFYPLGLVFMGLQKLIKPKNTEDQTVTNDELETIIDTMEDEGVIDEDHADLIQSALSLGSKTVYDIMTPRVDMVAIEVNDSVDKVLEEFFESQYSRLPVYEGDKDNVIGILQEKDFLAAVIKDNKANINVKDLIQAPLYVTKATKVDDLIREMQEVKKHFAIVSDEYGGTSGIVTMEDALEELVGEIYDEFDKEEDDYEINEIAENLYEMSSEVEIDELFEYLDIGSIPPTTYATIGGFVYDLMEGLPNVGSEITTQSLKTIYQDEKVLDLIYKLTFTITEVENRRIRRLTLLVEQTDISEHD